MWFNREQAALQLQRERLRLRSAELRLQVADRSQVLVAPLALADRLNAALRWLRLHPEVPLLVLGVFIVARPRRALRWAGRLWTGYGLWQRGLEGWQALQARRH